MLSFQTEPSQYSPAAFEHELRRHLGDPRPLRVLEAGCGRSWDIDLSGFACRITGVDMDQQALTDRLVNVKDLDDGILGDLRTVSLPAASYELVYCSWVLEHIGGAAAVLDRLFLWTRPGGLVLLRIPDGHSAYGFLTKHTPHWLHSLVAPRVWRLSKGGKPYPTVYDEVVSRRGIHDYCATHGHEILVEQYSDAHGSPSPVAECLTRACIRGVSVLSLGRLAPHDNLHFLIRKRPD